MCLPVLICLPVCPCLFVFALSFVHETSVSVHETSVFALSFVHETDMPSPSYGSWAERVHACSRGSDSNQIGRLYSKWSHESTLIVCIPQWSHLLLYTRHMALLQAALVQAALVHLCTHFTWTEQLYAMTELYAVQVCSVGCHCDPAWHTSLVSHERPLPGDPRRERVRCSCHC
jgi:hypothetical protein